MGTLLRPNCKNWAAGFIRVVRVFEEHVSSVSRDQIKRETTLKNTLSDKQMKDLWACLLDLIFVTKPQNYFTRARS